jgi:hypothetical protein
MIQFAPAMSHSTTDPKSQISDPATNTPLDFSPSVRNISGIDDIRIDRSSYYWRWLSRKGKKGRDLSSRRIV